MVICKYTVNNNHCDDCNSVTVSLLNVENVVKLPRNPVVIALYTAGFNFALKYDAQYPIKNAPIKFTDIVAKTLCITRLT